ncbi:carbohydrate esterase family 5 protein [Macroventuria anomochaeta]|uniref:Carbohydrate esterase family 5 protein n=1 Tax=Macroventuria anomochaeta TaxID=301207 RepID=A0ACB6RH65_9PLEO|nr:carbohydrate esterase family 5 protein [Macroventuria anomochaeta]KAF2621183.1 carbohydrate esterase family 5 protein [Macroventuria anomochaeta]
MKFFALTILATLAVASPIVLPESEAIEIQARQLGLSRTELESGSSSACPKAILIFARGSTETGNLGTLGVPLGNALESRYGAANVWVQGVGGPYDATLGDNFLPRGSSAAAIREGVRLLNLANSKCPNSAVITGGYSQGSALMAAALTDVTAAVRNRVVGTVLFGYTQNLQNRGGIPNYPSDRLEVFCAIGDLVCSGTLTITAAHLSYGDEAADEAPKFLISKIGA